MPVGTYRSEHAEAIVTLYNATAAGLPYCCPMNVAWFTEVIAAKHGFAPERLWVYEEEGRAVGYLQCSFISRSRDDVAFDRRVAGIDALCFAPDRLDVAAARPRLRRQRRWPRPSLRVWCAPVTRWLTCTAAARRQWRRSGRRVARRSVCQPTWAVPPTPAR